MSSSASLRRCCCRRPAVAQGTRAPAACRPPCRAGRARAPVLAAVHPVAGSHGVGGLRRSPGSTSTSASTDTRTRPTRHGPALPHLSEAPTTNLEAAEVQQQETAGSSNSESVQTQEDAAKDSPKGQQWALLILCLSYLHHSTAGFALPSFMPDISRDLHLVDTQSSLLTLGYTALYAITLVPIGLLADKFNRINLLTVSLTLWSVLTMAASTCNDFQDLLMVRVLFAASQAAQNPVCFSLIPELFPKNRSSAMALYNSAIYLGRALSFAGLFVFSGMNAQHTLGIHMIPMAEFDPSLWSLLYTVGDQAAVTPMFNYDFTIDYGSVQVELWRTLLFGLGPPGIALACMMSLSVQDPRSPSMANLMASSRFFWRVSNPKDTKRVKAATAEMLVSGSELLSERQKGRGHVMEASVSTSPGRSQISEKKNAKGGGVAKLLRTRAFLAVTAAATVNDLASWSLVAWQASFYERVYDIGPEVYAPLLACAIPVGGIVGGVGGGLLADRLGEGWGKAWLTSAANIASAPLLAASFFADDYQTSFLYLTAGFALSEAWRAPSAVLVREVADESLGATASAIHLCIRNLLGGLGPLAVAYLTTKLDSLQSAMLFVPACYALSGTLFFFTQAVVITDAKAKGAHQTHQQQSS